MGDDGWSQLSRTSSMMRPYPKDAPTEPWSLPSRPGDRDMRNPMRKRHSFFGRSSTDTRPVPTLNPTTSGQRDAGRNPLSRPTTAMNGESRRRKTDPLDSIRQSIFGSRRKASVPNIADRSYFVSRASAPHEAGQDALPTLPLERFRTEEDYYRYLRKLSISPPFNFEHVTHTGKQLPPLETVDEKDLTAEFWAASAHQRPRRHLNGIKADDLDEKHRAMGITRGSPSSRPTSPVPNSASPTDNQRSFGSFETLSSPTIDEAIFSAPRDVPRDPRDCTHAPPQSELPSRHPRRFSSLGALNQQSQGPSSQILPTFYESNSSGESIARSEDTEHATPDAWDVSPPLDAVLEEPDVPSIDKHSPRPDPPSQPLPPLPSQSLEHLISKFPSPSDKPVNGSPTSSAYSDTRPPSAKSRRSSRSGRKSRAASSASDFRRPSVMSWEDDVDYVYEQEAEATCDFDWQGGTPARESSIADSDGGVRLSAWIAPSPASNTDASSVLRPKHSSDDMGRNVSVADPLGLHRRVSSVGHRGFLAARRGSTELTKRNLLVPPVLELTPSSSHVSILSPVFSVTGADDEAPKTPFTPGALQFRGFDGVGRASNEYLSDPESVRTGGSKHRKSSSYGSYESVARPNPTHIGRETARWSFASSNSVPDLLHSRRKSKSSLHKSIISRPLESLPQSPDKATELGMPDGKESTIIPRASQIEPMRNTFVVRRPETTAGDRTSIPTAGRIGQRGRSTTSARFSRLLLPEDVAGIPADNENGRWI